MDKFSHPASLRSSPRGLPASPWVYVLRKWRDQNNLFARQAAAILGVPFDTYRGWEKGKHIPSEASRAEYARRMKAFK